MLIYFWRSSFFSLFSVKKGGGLTATSGLGVVTPEETIECLLELREGLAFSGGKAEASLLAFV